VFRTDGCFLLQHEEEIENKEKQKENGKLPTHAIICVVE
jgi:hypothetical protein